ncbi:enoyl-CoA hydratase-related protein [Embleya sp. NBC_00896]|uniref:enoyl-CoA hydratase-related protein n=1 Tax=Embleya sp. NBC_00896 TaxID=2975961 RepID=UPI0038678F66|nr:enoyl-CoA hydratase-related protein [Embleya sp. NBC_00896]
MDYQQISTSVRDHVMTVTLFRPVRLNAYTYRMRQEISDALDHADEDDEVRVVVFTGSGRAFCAGADLEMGADSFDPGVHAERFEGAVDDAEAFRDDGGRLVLRLYRSKKPLIAAINGAAVGVGATMTLPMDIRIASSNARFGFVFARRGITPDGCSTWFLPRVVGIDRALEWCFTGRVFDATEAKESGLVREVVAPADLLARAHELARTIAENTPAVAIALTRRLLWDMQSVPDPETAHLHESRALHWTGGSEDVREGVVAFLEKRRPKFGMRVSTDLPDLPPLI